jgi:hypothetical protein
MYVNFLNYTLVNEKTKTFLSNNSILQSNGGQVDKGRLREN